MIHSTYCKTPDFHLTVLDSVPTRSVITFHWVDLRILMNEYMGSNNMVPYTVIFLATEEEISQGNVLRKNRVQLKTGHSVCLLLKPPLAGYPVMLAERPCLLRLGFLEPLFSSICSFINNIPQEGMDHLSKAKYTNRPMSSCQKSVKNIVISNIFTINS